jgi:hypothetical protein
MNEIAKRKESIPTGLDTGVRNIVDEVVMFWPDDGKPVALRRGLTREEKAALQARVRELMMVLRPISQVSEEMKRAAEALAQMFLGFPSMRNVDAKAMITAYVQHMSDLPLYAIRAACDDVVKARVKGLDPDWPPTSVRLVEIAQSHTSGPIGESITIGKALAGKVHERETTPQEKERIRLGLQRMSKDLQEKADQERIDRVAKTQQAVSDGTRAKILLEYRRLGIEPVYADKEKTILLSPALANVKMKEKAR